MSNYQIIFLKSSEGTTNGGSDTDISFTIPSLTLTNRQLAISVDQVEFPISWTNVNATNNVIIYTITGSSSVTYNIQFGNYTAETLAVTITNLIPSLTVTYSAIGNRFSFTSTASNWSISGNSFRLLGLETSAGLTSPGNTIVFPNVCNLIQRNFGEVRITEVNGIPTNFIMCKIPLSADILQYVYFQNYNPVVSILKPLDTLTNLRIKIVDYDGNTFDDLRGVPWSASLRVEI